MRKYIYTFFGIVLLLACNDENDPIDSTPSTVQLIFPINNTECANNELTFTWNPAESPNGSPIIYNLYLSNNPNIDSDYEVYQTNNTQYTVSNIPRGHYVYWNVEATNGTESSYSEIFSFFTQSVGIDNIAPSIEYVSPQSNETVFDQSLFLQWSASDEETDFENLSFRIYFSEVGQDLELIYEGTGISSYEVNSLNLGTTYQWSIWVTDEDGATNVGDVYAFTVN